MRQGERRRGWCGEKGKRWGFGTQRKEREIETQRQGTGYKRDLEVGGEDPETEGMTQRHGRGRRD